jgi:uncharacterized protein YfaS (alpha-2-macroglobulin family)
MLIVDVYDEVGGENYRDVINLKYQSKKFSPFIYTDKGIYKPGDNVKFSIFCIDSETKPFNPISGSVTIYDSEKSKIKTFTNITFVKGKYKESFVLSENTAKGIWEVNFGGQGEVSSNISDFQFDSQWFFCQVQSKQFEVKEYVLPSYSVKVEVPTKVAIPSLTFQTKVIAEYTFGESVEGVAVVTFSMYYDYFNPRQVMFVKTININSAAEVFDVSIRDDLKIDNPVSSMLR